MVFLAKGNRLHLETVALVFATALPPRCTMPRLHIVTKELLASTVRRVHHNNTTAALNLSARSRAYVTPFARSSSLSDGLLALGAAPSCLLLRRSKELPLSRMALLLLRRVSLQIGGVALRKRRSGGKQSNLHSCFPRRVWRNQRRVCRKSVHRRPD
jgi:hypothetical protein